MDSPTTVPFNAIAGELSAKDRKAFVESMWAGGVDLLDETSGHRVQVLPDNPPQPGEYLFYVGFLGAKRDDIPTQHYLVPAQDDQTAMIRAHELYALQPRRRKGSALRVIFAKPPELRLGK